MQKGVVSPQPNYDCTMKRHENNIRHHSAKMTCKYLNMGHDGVAGSHVLYSWKLFLWTSLQIRQTLFSCRFHMLGNWDQICVNIQLIKVKVSLLRGFLHVQTNHEGQRDKHFEAISFAYFNVMSMVCE